MRVQSGLVLLVACFYLTGCGGEAGSARTVVSGKVTRGGQPIPKGRITLYPAKGTSAPTAGSEIKNGQYRFEAAPGTYRVEFHQTEERQPKPGRPQIVLEENILPDKFNSKSKLEVTVDATKPLVRDFDLDKEFGDAKAK